MSKYLDIAMTHLLAFITLKI